MDQLVALIAQLGNMLRPWAFDIATAMVVCLIWFFSGCQSYPKASFVGAFFCAANICFYYCECLWLWPIDRESHALGGKTHSGYAIPLDVSVNCGHVYFYRLLGSAK